MPPNQDSADPPVVYVVDSDAAVRDGLSALLATLNVSVRAFASAEAFLRDVAFTRPCCLIADILLPDMSGFELLEALRQRQQPIPTIILASHSDVPMAVRAMRAGAVDFLDKPLVDQVLLARVRQALAQY